MLRFSPYRAITSVVLLLLLLFIALFVRDTFIRPFLGDVLVVIWIYFVVTTFFIQTRYTAAGVVLFAYLVEAAQYFRLLERLELMQYDLLRIVLGATFDWMDILAYTLGGAVCMVLEKGFRNEKRRPETSSS